MKKRIDISDHTGPGGSPPELVPVAEAGATPMALSAAGDAGCDGIPLGDLLSDALFGEVIDISDLIPELLSPAIGTAQPSSVETPEFSQGGDIPAATDHAVALTILYDDDILASGDAML